jgi:putative ABC transport system substrate-binding protein
MRRREFIAALGAAVALRSAGARAQTAKLPTVGFLGIQTRANQEKWTTAFVQRLRELDWIEGRTVSIEYRWAEGSGDRMSEIAAEFVRLKVDVILTAGTAWRTRWGQAWSGVFHDPEAISPAYRTSRRKLPASESHCWARLFLICAG